MLVNPTGAFVREEVDFEHLKCVAHATQGVVQGLCRKVGRPGLGERSFVRIADAAGEDAGELSPAGEPLLEYFLHACRVSLPPATGWPAQVPFVNQLNRTVPVGVVNAPVTVAWSCTVVPAGTDVTI